jgi:hypothetical protein
MCDGVASAVEMLELRCRGEDSLGPSTTAEKGAAFAQDDGVLRLVETERRL